MQQYLVEHDLGGTLCLSLAAGSTVGEVVEAVRERAFPKSTASPSYAPTPGRIMSEGRIIGASEVAPVAPHLLRARFGRLLGGKGGFGAMLRTLAKQAGKKATRDFGACRDLHGRRLRHVNDEIRLRKWQEEREARERGEAVPFRDPSETPTGIANWHLGAPSWAEGLNAAGKQPKGFMKGRRKTWICRDWTKARMDRNPPKGAPNWWGCPRGRNCDFAHGEEELRGAAAEDIKEQKKDISRELVQKALDEYVSGAIAADTEAEMADAVAEGLRTNRKGKFRKVEQANAEAEAEQKAVLPIGAPPPPECQGCSWLDIVSGMVHLSEAGRCVGASSFGTVRALGISLTEGKWYYEVTLTTGGKVQVGWASTLFSADSLTGDGVGDDANSFGYDGCRAWNGEDGENEAKECGAGWSPGDVIGCLLDADSGSISFTLNGKSLGKIFEKLTLTGETGNDEAIGFFPAISLEDGEEIRLNLGLAPFVHKPPKGYMPTLQPLEGGEQVEKVATTSSSSASAAVQQAIEALPPPGPIDLDRYDAPSELIVFGMERLKKELMDRGVKCGGTLYERAARLYSLQGLTKDQYPTKLLAVVKKTK